jgi:hypothetical protein
VRNAAWAATVLFAVGLGYSIRPAPVVVTPVMPRDTAAQSLNTMRNSDRPMEQAQAPLPVAPPKNVATRSRVPVPTSGAAQNATRPEAATEKSVGDPAAAKLAAQSRRDSAATLSLVPRSAAQAPAGAPPALADRNATGSAATRLDSLVVSNPANPLVGRRESTLGGGRGGGRGLAPVARTAKVPVDTIALPEAMRRLGGTIRLVDGLVPLRLEAQGQQVRVIYPTSAGELVLQQQLVDGRVVFSLIAPRGFPPDSVARLRERIRE